MNVNNVNNSISGRMINSCDTFQRDLERPEIPLVEHVNILASRLESIESELRSIRRVLIGSESQLQMKEDCSGTALEAPNLEGETFRADRVICRIESIVHQIRDRLV